MPDVVINFNFGSGRASVPEVRQRSLDIQPEMVRYLIYEGLTPLDILQHRAVSGGKPKGKQCKKGQVCGNSCISMAKTCRKGLNGAQKEKAKTVKAKTSSKGKGGAATKETEQKQDVRNIPLDKLPKVYTGEGSSKYETINKTVSTSKGDIGITVYAGFQYATKDDPYDPEYPWGFDDKYGAGTPRAPIYDFSYNINGMLEKMDLPPKDGARVGREVMKTYQDVLKELPDGSIVSASAYDQDGNGEYRQRVYERAGLGTPDSPGGLQYGMVVSGKLRPLTNGEYVSLLEKALPE